MFDFHMLEIEISGQDDDAYGMGNSVLDLTRLGLKVRRMKNIFIHHRIAVHIV